MFRHHRTERTNIKHNGIDLKIKIKDFGPIEQGVIDLKPLTILIGPNNSGKSYAALLIHSIISAISKLELNRFSHFDKIHDYAIKSHYEIQNKETELLNKNTNELYIQKTINNMQKYYSVNLNKITRERANDISKEQIKRNIYRNFSSSFRDLIRLNAKSSVLNISSKNFSANITLTRKKPEYKVNNITHAILKFNTIQNNTKKTPRNFQNDDRIFDIKLRSGPLSLLPLRTKTDLISQIMMYYDKNLIKHSYYFPAARSGILQGHKALSASIIKNSPLAGIDTYEIPKYPGVIADHIAGILELNADNNTSFFDIAKKLESDILGGHVKIEHTGEGGVSEIKYSIKKQEMPLHRTSSTVSELAPITLYLKHLVQKNSLLVIEEPEAHLHPHNQILLAKYLVKLIRAGLNIVITTHSALILEQLNTYILVNKMSKQSKSKLKYTDDEYIKPHEINVYRFNKKPNQGIKIEQINIDKTHGISYDDFADVNKYMLNETIKIENEVFDDEN